MLKPVNAMIQQLAKVKGDVKADKIPEMMRSSWQVVMDDARDKLYDVQKTIQLADYKKLEEMQATAHLCADVVDNAKVVARTYKGFT